MVEILEEARPMRRILAHLGCFVLLAVPVHADTNRTPSGDTPPEQGPYYAWQRTFPGDLTALPYGGSTPIYVLNHSMTMPCTFELIEEFARRGYIRRSD